MPNLVTSVVTDLPPCHSGNVHLTEHSALSHQGDPLPPSPAALAPVASAQVHASIAQPLALRLCCCLACVLPWFGRIATRSVGGGTILSRRTSRNPGSPEAQIRLRTHPEVQTPSEIDRSRAVLSGRRCTACGLTVYEATRRRRALLVGVPPEGRVFSTRAGSHAKGQPG